MTARRFEIFVIVVIIAVIGIIYAVKQKPVLVATQTQVTGGDQTAPNTATSIRPDAGGTTDPGSPAPTTTISYQGVDGRNALDLLKSSHEVVTQHYDFGDLVVNIDGIKPDTSHFWAMYVNGQFSQVGASAYQTKSGDEIKWEVDAVVDTTK